jgi:hypothetical protein
MVEFCPECGNLLRKKSCGCGYGKPKSTSMDTTPNGLKKIWDPPSPNNIYCKITATSYDRLKAMLNKGITPDKLKDVREGLKNRTYSCSNCLYYHEDINLCKFKNKYLTKDSICKSFEPFPEN